MDRDEIKELMANMHGLYYEFKNFQDKNRSERYYMSRLYEEFTNHHHFDLLEETIITLVLGEMTIPTGTIFIGLYKLIKETLGQYEEAKMAFAQTITSQELESISRRVEFVLGHLDTLQMDTKPYC